MASQWFENGQTGLKRTIGVEGERRIGSTAGRQKRLIRAEQLRAIGLGDTGIRRRVKTGRLHRIHPGVFAVHPPPYSRTQLRLAAVFACGLGSAVSHLHAAAALTLVENNPPLPIDITLQSQRGRRLAGVRTHRVSLLPRDRTGVDGVPCTGAARTLVDIAPLLDDEALEDALIAADSLRILNRTRLDELIAERFGRPGVSRLAALVADDPVETQHRNERRMFSICREFGIPRPLTRYRVEVDGRTFYADFCWPDIPLVVEFDSWRWHGGRSRTEYDRDRDQLSATAGLPTVRFTRDQVVHQRQQTGNRLVALTRSAQLPGVTR
jgi:predicted transcriptional regulator of viral defense system